MENKNFDYFEPCVKCEVMSWLHCTFDNGEEIHLKYCNKYNEKVVYCRSKCIKLKEFDKFLESIGE